MKGITERPADFILLTARGAARRLAPLRQARQLVRAVLGVVVSAVSVRVTCAAAAQSSSCTHAEPVDWVQRVLRVLASLAHARVCGTARAIIAGIVRTQSGTANTIAHTGMNAPELVERVALEASAIVAPCGRGLTHGIGTRIQTIVEEVGR